MNSALWQSNKVAQVLASTKMFCFWESTGQTIVQLCYSNIYYSFLALSYIGSMFKCETVGNQHHLQNINDLQVQYLLLQVCHLLIQNVNYEGESNENKYFLSHNLLNA